MRGGDSVGGGGRSAPRSSHRGRSWVLLLLVALGGCILVSVLSNPQFLEVSARNYQGGGGDAVPTTALRTTEHHGASSSSRGTKTIAAQKAKGKEDKVSGEEGGLPPLPSSTAEHHGASSSAPQIQENEEQENDRILVEAAAHGSSEPEDPWDAAAWDPPADISAKNSQRSARAGTAAQSSGRSVGVAFPKCAAMGPKFVRYVDAHFQRLGRRFDEQKLARQRSTTKIGRLIYNCESNKKKRFCGGTGDRFRGMITTFFLALVTKRQFYLHQPAPAPLQKLLRPSWFNWVPHDVKSGGVEAIPLDDHLMKLQRHRKFVANLAKTPNSADLRLQSNSFGIDPYLYGSTVFSKVLTEEMGLSQQCNMTGYFGCLWDVLFTPSDRFNRAVDKVFVSATAVANGHDGGSLSGNGGDAEDREVAAAAANGQFSVDEVRARPFLSVQIRIGGDWATGLRIKEPFRTPPATLPPFYSVVEELRTGLVHPWSIVANGGAKVSTTSTTLAEEDALKDCMIFVSSDAPKLITEFQRRFGKRNVFFVPNSFGHTDTLVIGDVMPEKFAKISPLDAESIYLQTLVSHYLLGEGAHLVMAQSGFGDTAYWRGHRSASSIFVDMNKPKVAWQHHSGYRGRKGGATTTAGAVAATYTEQEKELWGADCGSRAVMNRIIDTRAKPKPFYFPQNQNPGGGAPES